MVDLRDREKGERGIREGKGAGFWIKSSKEWNTFLKLIIQTFLWENTLVDKCGRKGKDKTKPRRE